MREFKVGDKVTAWGCEGTVVENNSYLVRVIFKHQRYEEFFPDGRFTVWHKEPSLKHVEDDDLAIYERHKNEKTVPWDTTLRAKDIKKTVKMAPALVKDSNGEGYYITKEFFIKRPEKPPLSGCFVSLLWDKSIEVEVEVE